MVIDHDIFVLVALCAIVGLVALFATRAFRRLRPSVAASVGGEPQLHRTGLTQRIVFTVIGGGMMIPDLLVPIFGEVADLVIAIVLAYAWYTYYAQAGAPVVPVHRTRDFPLGVDECFRCNGTGFTDGKIDPLCGGKGWVPAQNRPAVR